MLHTKTAFGSAPLAISDLTSPHYSYGLPVEGHLLARLCPVPWMDARCARCSNVVMFLVLLSIERGSEFFWLMWWVGDCVVWVCAWGGGSRGRVPHMRSHTFVSQLSFETIVIISRNGRRRCCADSR